MKKSKLMAKKTERVNEPDGDFEVWIDDSKTESFGKCELPPKTEEEKRHQEAFFKELDKEFKVA